MSNVVRPTSDEAKMVVSSIPLKPDVDVETFNSIGEATDPTHIRVDTTPTEEPQLFDLKQSMGADAKQVKELHADYQKSEELKQLKHEHMHVRNMSEMEQKAIVGIIIEINPDVVFEALVERHKEIDDDMKHANLVDVNRWELHEKKYQELFMDLVTGEKDLNEYFSHFRTRG